MNRKQRRENERLIRKNQSKMVCMWCKTPGNKLTRIKNLTFHCPTCNDETKLVFKKHYENLNESYKTKDNNA